jgi:hypothetical protein
MITRRQGISHRHSHIRILFAGVGAAAMFAAPLAWAQLDAPTAHAAPGTCSPNTPGCPGYFPPQTICPSAVLGCPGYIPPPQPDNNFGTPPSQGLNNNSSDGKPEKGDGPGKPDSTGTGGNWSQSSPPAGAPNPTDHSGPAPDKSAPAPAAPPAPAPVAPAPDMSAPAPAAPAPDMSAPAPMPDMSAPAPVAPMPDMSAPAPMPDMSSSAPAISMPSMSRFGRRGVGVHRGGPGCFHTAAPTSSNGWPCRAGQCIRWLAMWSARTRLCRSTPPSRQACP